MRNPTIVRAVTVLTSAVLAAGLTAGCADPQPTPVSTPRASSRTALSSDPSGGVTSSAEPTPQVTGGRLLALDGDGLEVFTEGSQDRARLTFTTSIADVEQTVTALLAQPTSREPSPDCSPDAMITSYPAGFRLIAEKEPRMITVLQSKVRGTLSDATPRR